MKTCNSCLLELSETRFSNDKHTKDGLQYKCKHCCIEYSKKYRIISKHKVKACKHKHYLKHINEIKIRDKQYYLNNKQQIIKNTTSYIKKRCIIDPRFKLIRNLRCKFYQTIKGICKHKHSVEYLMCSIDSFNLYIESLWLPGMIWNNYGFGIDKWNIDHIIPCSFFNPLDPVELYMCFRWQNLQPMWQIDNFKKSNKIINAF